MKICDHCASKLVIAGIIKPHVEVLGANGERYEQAYCDVCDHLCDCVTRNDLNRVEFKKYKPTFREELSRWCGKMMKSDNVEELYPTWQKSWRMIDEHLCIALRVVENDVGGDIVILSCDASYAGSEENWNGVNIGVVHSICELNGLYSWLDERSKTHVDK